VSVLLVGELGRSPVSETLSQVQFGLLTMSSKLIAFKTKDKGEVHSMERCFFYNKTVIE
jgi:hypothetical protein